MENSFYENYNKENPAINVHYGDSSYNSYYQMKAPFQITVEYCSGISENDYLNIITFSPNQVYFAPASYSFYSPFYTNRTLHRHDFYEIMIVLKGEIIHQIESNEYSYSAGTCCLLNRNLQHAEKFIGEAMLLFVGLPSSFINEILSSSQAFYFQAEKDILDNPILSFFKPHNPSVDEKAYLDFTPIKRASNSFSGLFELAELLVKTMLFPKLGSTYILKGLIGSLFQILFGKEYYHVTYIIVDSNADFLLFVRISHLLEDTNGRIKRHELEQALNYSGNYLNRVVNKYTGKCLFDYGMHFCLKKACELLLSTDYTINEIEQKLNFSNHTHFYKLFKKTYGMTPNKYRKTHKNSTKKILNPSGNT